MSSPIPTPTSQGLYVPIHRRSASSSGTSSPSSSSRALSPSPSPSPSTLPIPLPTPGVYTPAALLSLAHSPLVAHFSASRVDALRAVAPEVLKTRKQRKALAWHARQPARTAPTHRRTSSRGSHTSESEEDRAVSWRRA
ncbi:hypothetical protein HD554DRAFT_460063 [Boletus coccyginus]|nr:hypothetical protein HD554DRAFT_460063 [Boletus coccyginus]